MISLRDLLQASRRPFLSAIVAAAFAFTAQFFYGQSLSPFPRLLLGGGILLIVYLWMLLYVMGQKAFYLDLLQGLRKRSSVGEKESVANY
jgi:PST family polysaccharide transporter